MNEKLTYSVEEAARRIGVSKNAIYALARAGKIPFIRIGSRYIISATHFDSWFQEQCLNHAEIDL